MPRIDTLRQGQRLQVSSPVPIASTSSAAAPGEAIAKLGNQMMDTAVILNKLDIAQRNDQIKRVQDFFKSKADMVSKDAFLIASKDYKDPDGKDQIQIGEKHFGDTIGPMIESLKDPELQKVAQDASVAAWDSRGHDFLVLGTETRSANAKVADQNLWGTQLQQITQDPSQWKQVLSNRVNYLDTSANLTYNPAKKAAEKISNSKEAAMTAIETYMQDGGGRTPDFNSARKIQNDAAPFFEGKQEEVLKRINDAESSYKNRISADRLRTENAALRAQHEMQQENFAKIQIALAGTQDLDERADILRRARDLADPSSGGLSETALTKITTSANSLGSALRPTDGQQKSFYLTQIHTDLMNNEKMAEKIANDGALSPSSQVDLYKEIIASKARNLKADSDQTFARKLDVGNKIIDGVSKSLSAGSSPDEKGKFESQLRLDYLRDVDKNVDPVNAANDAQKSVYTKIKMTRFIDMDVLPAPLQMDSKTLHENLPILVGKWKSLEAQGDAGQQKAKYSKQAYLQRMTALRFLEGGERKR